MELPLHHGDLKPNNNKDWFVSTHVILGVFVSLIAAQFTFIGSMVMNTSFPSHQSTHEVLTSSVVGDGPKFLFPMVAVKTSYKSECLALALSHAKALDRTMVVPDDLMQWFQMPEEGGHRVITQDQFVEILYPDYNDTAAAIQRKQQREAAAAARGGAGTGQQVVPQVIVGKKPHKAFFLTLVDAACEDKKKMPVGIRRKAFKGKMLFGVSEDICMRHEMITFEDGIEALKDRLKDHQILAMMLTAGVCQ
eukprot:TRINITY_DN11059_c0_g1_i1.p1 TRINITY_DN11059_c0_g1~~TRINITY_DN11059_c0_g1_i1.p1  ORF type:complete len:250 (+),score=49.62 TRINITY_DN11059_c0_g1_i1:65-814(+)